LGDGLFGGRLVFRSYVCSDIEWSEAAQCSGSVQWDYEKVADGGQRFVYPFCFCLRDATALLRRSHPGKAITVVWDNAAYQQAKLVQKLAKELGMTLLYLPSYSPNLNLIERRWMFVKKQMLNNRYYETFENFKTRIDDCLKNIDKEHKSQIAPLMTLRFQVCKNDQIIAG
jgi:transposase